ncbi:MAG: DNA gyrase subunit A [Candidatus Micrarchaeia archaeon]
MPDLDNNSDSKNDVPSTPAQAPLHKVTAQPIERELSTSYLDYAMSVIVGRALPDVRDGFKPVHRRVLFSMYELSNTHSNAYKKSARIVGEVLGKYHPHGDASIYSTLVRMAQEFSLRYPLVDGQGNFGSIDGDNAAAMRYTEVRMQKLADEMLADIDKGTVDFTPNFDGTLKEPIVLPSKVPNLLINGSSGIAVGMATNIPPHNLGEICDATMLLIDNWEVDDSYLFNLVRGPDFPTGGIITGRAGIIEAYKTGRGTIRVRGVAQIETDKKDKQKQYISISEIPYMVNKANLVIQIADLVKDKKIEGISDILDLSDKKGIEVRVLVKKGANAEVVLNHLYSKTQLEVTFGINNLALVGQQPKTLSLRELLSEFILHRRNVITRRCNFDLGVARDRKHILEGLKIALVDIDKVINAIKSASDTLRAKEVLISKWKLSEKQALAILEMKLSRLTGLERDKIEQEDATLAKLISELVSILADKKKIDGLIKTELTEIRSKYSDERRTKIIEGNGGQIDDLDLIPDESVAVIVTENDYIKRISLSEYRSQKRGGKGVIGTETKEEDRIKDLLIASTHDTLLFFTNSGMVHWLQVHKIPATSRYSTGKAIVNLLDIKDDKIASWVSVREFKEDQSLVMATRKGVVKRTSLSEYGRPRRGGIRAITLREGDELIQARKTDGNTDLLLASSHGQAIRFSETDVREIGRAGQGVKGISLRKDDYVVDLTLCNNPAILTICENGYGKRTPVEEYRQQGRGGMGIISIKTSERNGKVIGVCSVSDEDEILLLSSSNKAIRMPVKDISIVGRNTQGVRLMRLDEGERLVAMEHLKPEDFEGDDGSLQSGPVKPSGTDGFDSTDSSKLVFPKSSSDDEDSPDDESKTDTLENSKNGAMQKTNSSDIKQNTDSKTDSSAKTSGKKEIVNVPEKTSDKKEFSDVPALSEKKTEDFDSDSLNGRDPDSPKQTVQDDTPTESVSDYVDNEEDKKMLVDFFSKKKTR